MKQLLVLALAVLLRVSIFANNETPTTGDAQPEAEGGVAIIRVDASTATRTPDVLPYHDDVLLRGLKYTVRGSTIEGFHKGVADSTEITNPIEGRRLPRGTYLVELTQPRPAARPLGIGCPSVFHDATAWHNCAPMRFVASNSHDPTLAGSGDGERVVLGGPEPVDSAAIINFDGVKISHFWVEFRLLARLISTQANQRTADEWVGSVKFTKLD